MSMRTKCPACNKEGKTQSEERKIKGISQRVYVFTCAFCNYQSQYRDTEDNLLDSLREDKFKIESLTAKGRRDREG